MFQSRPKLKSKKLIIVSLLLLCLSVLLFPIASLSGNFSAVIQICSIASAAISLFILIKYVIPDYLYTLEDGHLTIHKVTKAQSVCVADIELYYAKSELLTEKEFKTQKKSLQVKSFIKNPQDEDIRYIVFSISGEEIAIMFEPDELFRNEFSKALVSIKNEEETD